MTQRVDWIGVGLVAGVLVVMPLAMLLAVGLTLPGLLNIPLPANPSTVTIPLTWLASILAALVFYKLDQQYSHLLSRPIVLRGAVLALIPALLMMLLVLAIYFLNVSAQQTPYPGDPRDVLPFGWEGMGNMLFRIVFLGWPLSVLVLVPAAFLLCGTIIANWRTIPDAEKRLSIALLAATALVALTWPVWGTVGTWLAD